MRLKFITVLLTLCAGLYAQYDRATKVAEEKQYISDQGDGTYINPILAGRFADPSLIRVGGDFYMTHSGGSADGLLIWHSRDLVNWEPLTRVNTGDYGRPWAPDLVYVDGMFFIYVTLAHDRNTFSNYVFYADRIEGPWSKPFDLKIKGLYNPGHITDKNGERFLHFSGGMAVPLNESGDLILDTLKNVCKGWDYPSEWLVECPCLESPKLLQKNKMFYMVSAMGGDEGPSTSHMAVVARSDNPMGPWENSPYNPLIKTKQRNEKWWSTGHATLIDDVEGNWWAIFHGYENSFRSLGHQTLLLPVEWNNEGWPVISDSLSADAKIKKPAGENIGHGMVLSDDFTNDNMGIQWGFPTQDCKCNFMSGDGQLAVIAHGNKITEGALTSISPVNTSYAASVKVEVDPDTEGGILFYGERNRYSGIGLKKGTMLVYGEGELLNVSAGDLPMLNTNTLWLKLENRQHDLVYYYSTDGVNWIKLPWSDNDSALGKTYVALYGIGMGNVIFETFTYLGLDNN